MSVFKYLFLTSLLLIAFINSCEVNEDDLQIMTVNGSVFSSEMGITLVHEHVLVDWIGADSTGYYRWNREEVIKRALPFFEEAREKGVKTILECTPPYLGRDPFILAELSRLSGIQILTNTGYYGAVDNKYMPGFAQQISAKQIADRWIYEFEYGIDESNIRPGFMKISVGEERPLSGFHQKIVKAAIITHLQTGMTIVSHTVGDEPALDQIKHLKNHRISPSAWVWAHAQSGSIEGNLLAAEEGAWISLDGIRHDPSRQAGEHGSIEWYAKRISGLKEAGYLNQVLISHDAGYYEAGKPSGGSYRGYTDIFDHLIPALRDLTFTDEEIRQLLVYNPRQAYAIEVRRSELKERHMLPEPE